MDANTKDVLLALIPVLAGLFSLYFRSRLRGRGIPTLKKRSKDADKSDGAR